MGTCRRSYAHLVGWANFLGAAFYAVGSRTEAEEDGSPASDTGLSHRTREMGLIRLVFGKFGKYGTVTEEETKSGYKERLTRGRD
jgi:hypothetical protein